MTVTTIPVPAGQIATIVTCLQMFARPPAPAPVKSALRLVRWPSPVDRDAYRALFRRIGEPWLWRGRLVMDDAALAAVLDAPTTQVFVAARRDGTAVGLLEIDFGTAGEAELVYFGLAPGMTGHGHGAWLMAHAMELCWQPGVHRVWVHTCDLDHPAALDFYRRQGFEPFARYVEIYADPRATGLHPADAAPHLALL